MAQSIVASLFKTKMTSSEAGSSSNGLSQADDVPASTSSTSWTTNSDSDSDSDSVRVSHPSEKEAGPFLENGLTFSDSVDCNV